MCFYNKKRVIILTSSRRAKVQQPVILIERLNKRKVKALGTKELRQMDVDKIMSVFCLTDDRASCLIKT